jgi:XTP/dITP diphosphohydrolase
MPTVVVATGNPGKVREFTLALAIGGIDTLGIEVLSDRTPVEETGPTFEANARLKAEGYSRRTPHAVLADDSGLAVDALDGGPGIQSARYGSPTLSDPARCRAILKALIDVPDDKRTARFRCVLAVARDGRTIATFDGVVEGTILRELRGENGFGYDPIFFHAASRRTFAELTREEKESVSHRGQAIRRLLEAVRNGTLAIPD